MICDCSDNEDFPDQKDRYQNNFFKKILKESGLGTVEMTLIFYFLSLWVQNRPQKYEPKILDN